MWESLPILSDNDRYDDLRDMNNLLSRTPEHQDQLKINFERHIKDAAFAKLVIEKGRNVVLEDPGACVDALLGVYWKKSEIVKKSFRGDDTFTVCLNESFKESFGPAATGKPLQVLPQLLAKQAEGLLRKKEELEYVLDNIACPLPVTFGYLKCANTRYLFHIIRPDKIEGLRVVTRLCFTFYLSLLSQLYPSFSLLLDQDNSLIRSRYGLKNYRLRRFLAHGEAE
ncbi:hypothetical protein CPB84DRAFT_616854 [Gymnopilus junonius]|uniref:Cullin N-terminal domain-containing protein n=1 Tax=Gymnopilus junonius TaxID=109634 RepID=A0A9P5TR92_GYMJU|nr:hypothetical protein CPB84DRAFT_616854 [Gymnopilus junonius]